MYRHDARGGSSLASRFNLFTNFIKSFKGRERPLKVGLDEPGNGAGLTGGYGFFRE